jgi:hypothetical protein
MNELARLHQLIDTLPPERVLELLKMLEATTPGTEPANPPQEITADELRAMLDL